MPQHRLPAPDRLTPSWAPLSFDRRCTPGSPVWAARCVPGVMHVGDVDQLQRRYTVRRVVLLSSGTESFTVIDPDLRPIGVVDELSRQLTNNERSPKHRRGPRARLAGVLDVPRRARPGVGCRPLSASDPRRSPHPVADMSATREPKRHGEQRREGGLSDDYVNYGFEVAVPRRLQLKRRSPLRLSPSHQ